MLVLSRRKGQKIRIGENIVVTVIELTKGQVKLGIEAPSNVSVHRQEVHERIQAAAQQQQKAG